MVTRSLPNAQDHDRTNFAHAVVSSLIPHPDHICVRVHLRMECVHHQVLNSRSLPTNFWHDIHGLVLRCADGWLSCHQSHCVATIHRSDRLLLEPMERGRSRCCSSRRSEGDHLQSMHQFTLLIVLKFYLGVGIINLFGDICILTVPISSVVRLRLARTQKIAISLIFLLGSL